MAYLDLAVHETTGFAHPSTLPAPSPRPLSEIERKAVLLARIDPISSVANSSFRRTLHDLLLGPERINPLADPRLEALRCFAVAVAHDRDEMADREEARLIALNFTPGQIGDARALALSCRPALS
jgi:hypothetical protein